MNHLFVSLDERWIDSVYGVINSAYETGSPMSLLQLMVFWDEAASAPGNLPKPLAIAATYILGEFLFSVEMLPSELNISLQDAGSDGSQDTEGCMISTTTHLEELRSWCENFTLLFVFFARPEV